MTSATALTQTIDGLMGRPWREFFSSLILAARSEDDLTVLNNMPQLPDHARLMPEDLPKLAAAWRAIHGYCSPPPGGARPSNQVMAELLKGCLPDPIENPDAPYYRQKLAETLQFLEEPDRRRLQGLHTTATQSHPVLPNGRDAKAVLYIGERPAPYAFDLFVTTDRRLGLTLELNRKNLTHSLVMLARNQLHDARLTDDGNLCLPPLPLEGEFYSLYGSKRAGEEVPAPMSWEALLSQLSASIQAHLGITARGGLVEYRIE